MKAKGKWKEIEIKKRRHTVGTPVPGGLLMLLSTAYPAQEAFRVGTAEVQQGLRALVV